MSNIHDLNKQITDNILPKFASVTDPISLLAPVQELKKAVTKTKNLNWDLINEKNLLSKRLTQSLLLISTSDGLHQEILDFYELLFTNLIQHNEYLGVNLGLYFPGVFSFFQLASHQRKFQMINTFLPNTYLKLTKEEIYLSLPGFIKGLLPGLEEIQEKMIKETLDLFRNVINLIKEKDFYSILYSVLLKTPHIRLPAIKLMLSEIPSLSSFSKKYKHNDTNQSKHSRLRSDSKQKENIVYDEKIIQDYRDSYIPDTECLSVNAIICLIEDENGNVKKGILDFLIKKLSFDSPLFEKEQRVNLLIALLNLLKKPESNITRRILQWILGHHYQEDDLNINDEGIKKLLEDLKSALETLLLEKIQTPTDLGNYIKIFENFFRLKEVFIEGLFSQISLSLIEMANNLNSITNSPDMLMKIRKFCLSDEIYPIMLWDALKTKTNESISELSEESSEVDAVSLINLVNLLSFCKALIPPPSLEIVYNIINKLIDLIILISDEVTFKEISIVLNVTNEFICEYKNLMFKMNNFQQEKKQDIVNLESNLSNVNKELLSKKKSLENNNKQNPTELYQNKELYYETYLENIKKESTITINNNHDENKEDALNNVENSLNKNELYNNINANSVRHCFRAASKTYSTFYIGILKYIYSNQDDYLVEERNILKLSTELMIVLENLENPNNMNSCVNCVKKDKENVDTNTIDADYFPRWSKKLIFLIFSSNVTLAVDAIKYISDIISLIKHSSLVEKIKEYYLNEVLELEINYHEAIKISGKEGNVNKDVISEAKNEMKEGDNSADFFSKKENKSNNEYFKDSNQEGKVFDKETEDDKYETNKDLCTVTGTCLELVYQKLWVLLDEYLEQSRVITLIYKLFGIYPQVFNFIVKRAFRFNTNNHNSENLNQLANSNIQIEEENSNKNLNVKEDKNVDFVSKLSYEDLNQLVISIKRFKQFWKLAMEFYPHTNFFENNNEIILRMLDFLNNDHPVLRHYSKSWVVHTTPQFFKLLDPIISQLTSISELISTSYKLGEFTITQQYDVNKVLKSFDQLKNIILNVKNPAIHYLLTVPVTTKAISQDPFKDSIVVKSEISESKAVNTNAVSFKDVKQNQPTEISNSKDKKLRIMYFEYIINLTLRFIQVEFEMNNIKNSYNNSNDSNNSDDKNTNVKKTEISTIYEKEFKTEHFLVKSASSEFLEFLISFVDDKSRIIGSSIDITDCILHVLDRYIKRKDEVVQTQLLNLLTVIYQINIDLWKNNTYISSQVFNSKLLHSCIIQGLQTNYTYLRSHYIEFAEILLPLFQSLITLEENNGIATNLLITNSDFLAKNILQSKQIIVNPKPRNSSFKNVFNNKNSLGQKKPSLNIRSSFLKIKKTEYENKKDNEADKVMLNDKEIETNLSSKNTTNIKQENSTILSSNDNRFNSISEAQLNEFNKTNVAKLLEKLYISNFNIRLINENDNRLNDQDTSFVIKGIKKILFHYMGIVNPFSDMEDLNWAEMKKILQKTNYFPLQSNKEKTNNVFTTVFKNLSHLNNKNSNNVNNKLVETSSSNNNLVSMNVFEDVLVSLLFAWKNEGPALTNYKDFYLSSKGIMPLDFKYLNRESVALNENSRDLEKLEKQMHLKSILYRSPLKAEIMIIIQNLFLSNPYEFIFKYINLWMKEKHRYNLTYNKMSEIQTNQFLLTLIEVLIITQIPPDVVLLLIRKSLKLSQVKSKTKVNGAYPYVFSEEDCIYEHKICQFIYAYISHIAAIKDLDINSFAEILSIINFLQESKYPFTRIWLFEIFNLVVSMISGSFNYYRRSLQNPSSKTLEEIDSLKAKTYKEYMACFKDLSEKMLEFVFETDVKVKFQIDKLKTHILFPLPPTIYNLMNNFLNSELLIQEKEELNRISTNLNLNSHGKLSNSNVVNVNNIEISNNNNEHQIRGSIFNNHGNSNTIRILKTKTANIQGDFEILGEKVNIDYSRNFYTNFSLDFANSIVFKNEEYIEIMRKVAFITCDAIYFNIIKNIYKEEPISKINLSNVLNKIFIVLNEEDKESFHFEFANHFLMTLMKDASQIVVVTHKKNILDYYFSKNFFKMTDKCLKQWKVILKNYAYPELLDEFLYK